MARFSVGDIRSAQFDTVTTATVVVPAAPAGRKYVVMGLVVSMASAGAFTLESDDGDDGSANVTWLSAMPVGATFPLTLPTTDLGYFGAVDATDEHGISVTATEAASGSILYAEVNA